jgi:hypothetical protein
LTCGSAPGSRAKSALGAVCVRVLYADEQNESCIVMQDIEGNEFDLD